MPQPTTEPTELGKVKLYLSISDDRLDDAVTEACDAVNAFVRTLRVADVDGEDWPAYVMLGATMMAGRLVRRRNSPSGVEAFTDAGGVYVSRNDPDVAAMLRIGAYQQPSVG